MQKVTRTPAKEVIALGFPLKIQVDGRIFDVDTVDANKNRIGLISDTDGWLAVESWEGSFLVAVEEEKTADEKRIESLQSENTCLAKRVKELECELEARNAVPVSKADTQLAADIEYLHTRLLAAEHHITVILGRIK